MKKRGRGRGREGEIIYEEEKLKSSLDKYNSQVLWGTVFLCIFLTYQAWGNVRRTPLALLNVPLSKCILSLPPLWGTHAFSHPVSKPVWKETRETRTEQQKPGTQQSFALLTPSVTFREAEPISFHRYR